MTRNEVAYEKLVDRLAQKWENTILYEAVSAVQDVLDANPEAPVDECVDAAKDAVEADLFGSTEWGRVEAVDISDIAYDAGHRAYATIRSWEGEQ
jgi:hypothetical protein